MQFLPKYKLSDFLKNRRLYFLLIPGLVFFAVFRYVPIFGLRIAFMNYNQLNEMRIRSFKKIAQTLLYLPRFTFYELYPKQQELEACLASRNK